MPAGVNSGKPWRAAGDRAAIVSAFGPLIALALACVFFATQSDRFLTGQNLSLILQQVVVIGVIAIGQTLIVLTAGIDLSCGMVMALGSIVMSKAAVDHGLDAGWAIACGLLATTAFGFANGALITCDQSMPEGVNEIGWRVPNAKPATMKATISNSMSTVEAIWRVPPSRTPRR